MLLALLRSSAQPVRELVMARRKPGLKSETWATHSPASRYGAGTEP